MNIFRNKKTVYIILGHVTSWLLVFLFNYGVIKNFNLPVDYQQQVLSLLFFMLVFYINYFVLMPFLLKKKIGIYLGLSILLLGVSIMLKSKITTGYTEGNRKEILQLKRDIEFDQSHFKYRPKTSINSNDFINWRRITVNSYSLFFFFFLSFLLRFTTKWLEGEKQKVQLEKDRVETELAFLKQQINPHFLFNSLNSIYSLSISKSDKTTPSILKLSSILRYLLYESESSSASLQNELSVIQDYIELQKLRLTEKVEVVVSVKGNADHFLFESFIILPIIENAFKYGVDNLNNSFISIDIKVENEKLELKVENKVVQRPAMLRKDSGIGLKNVKRRLEILYPDNHYFHSEESNEVFSVNMQIKLKSI